MNQAGVPTAITLPTPLTLTGATAPIRYAVFMVGSTPVIICVNGAQHDFWIDKTGVARRLQISPPSGVPTVAAGGSTGLTGTYQVAVTFKIKDSNGATLLESGLGPASLFSASLTNQSLAVSNIPVSPDSAVNARGMYRTTSGGTIFYPWFDLDDNTTIADDRGGADATLSILPATATRIGMPPDLKLCTSWKQRLWGVPRYKVDSLRFTEDSIFYAWAFDNEIIITPQNNEPSGITALIPRRDTLGVAKRTRFYMIAGDATNSFQRVPMSEFLGCVSQESVVVIQNVAYMLGLQGVNEWSDYGIRNISEEQVDAWFRTDTYFNRSLFGMAQGRYNPDTEAYELLLASAGSSVLDKWVAYHIRSRTWYGPHKTDATTFTCTGNSTEAHGYLQNPSLLPITVFGGTDGNIYKRDLTQVNDNGTAVDFQIDLPPMHAQEPDYLKIWGRPTIHTRAETQGVLQFTPTVGDLTDLAGTPYEHDLTQDRETMDILGAGRYCQIGLQHKSTTEGCRVFGIELPYNIIGRR